MSSKTKQSKCGDRNRKPRCRKKLLSMTSHEESLITNTLDWTLNVFLMINYGKCHANYFPEK